MANASFVIYGYRLEYCITVIQKDALTLWVEKGNAASLRSASVKL